MVLTTKIFDAIGLTRDSIALFWTKWCAFIVALAAMGTNITAVGIPEKYAPIIAGLALFISVSSAQHRTSELPGKNDYVSPTTLNRIGMFLLFSLAMTACSHLNPPAGTYTPAVTQTYQADVLIKDLDALGQTARNLNALPTTDKEHLSDLTTSKVRDVSLIMGAGINAYGNGATTLQGLKTSLDSITLAPGLLTAARMAVDQAILEHGAQANTMLFVKDVFTSFMNGLPPTTITNKSLAAALAAVQGALAGIQ